MKLLQALQRKTVLTGERLPGQSRGLIGPVVGNGDTVPVDQGWAYFLTGFATAGPLHVKL